MIKYTIKDYDKESKEAEIIISDGTYEILCYAGHLTDPKQFDNEQIVLKAFLPKKIKISEEHKFIANKNSQSYFSYFLQGRVNKLSKGFSQEAIISIGELDIYIRYSLPGDIKIGDFVNLNVSRIDI